MCICYICLHYLYCIKSIFMTHVDTSMKPCMYYTCNSARDSKPLGLIIVGDKNIGTLNDSEEWSVSPFVSMAACCVVVICGLSKNWGPQKIQEFLTRIPSNMTIVYLNTTNSFRSFWRGDHVPIDAILLLGMGSSRSRMWCRPSLSGAAAKWSLPTRTPSSSTGWRMPQGSSDFLCHGCHMIPQKVKKWLG